MSSSRALLLGLALVLSACSTALQLTDRGTLVTPITGSEVPDGCSIVGDVGIGIPPDAGRPGTEDELVILMRNKTAQMGGTHVVIEMRDRREDGGSVHYVGRGRAYRCVEVTPAEEP
jgi:hypothetical protein